MSEEVRKAMITGLLSELKEEVGSEYVSGIPDPTLKLGYEHGYAAAMGIVAVYVRLLEKYLEV